MQLLIRRATHQDVLEVHRIQKAEAGEYIWPRTAAEFDSLAQAGQLYVALIEDTGEIVGMCYIRLDEDTKRWEFGGVFVKLEARNTGLGSALGRVAIGAQWLAEIADDNRPLIAHVHVENRAPRAMLVHQLGFVQEGQETAPGDVAPPNMLRNADGDVVGDLFTYSRPALERIAEWFEGFGGTLQGKDARAALTIDVKPFADFQSDAVEELRRIATEGRD